MIGGCATKKSNKVLTGLTQEQMEERSQYIRGTHYDLNLDLASSESNYIGVLTVNFILEDTFDVFLDFAGGKVEQVSINGKASEYNYDGQKIWTKEKFYKKGRNKIVVTYSHTYSNNSEGFYRFLDPEDNSTYVYTDFEPFKANELFPSFDQPNLKATYKLTIRAPKDWTVITYDYATEFKKTEQATTWFFPESQLFSTYILNISAGPFASWDSHFTTKSARVIPLKLYSRKSLARFVDANNWFSLSKKGLEYFEEYFGREYPFNKYDQILVPDFNWSGMENVAAVTYTERFIFKSRPTEGQEFYRSSVILHEMAHQWFGDLVTMEWWNGLWLNESFATLMAYEALDDITDMKGVWQNFAGRTKGWAYWTDQLVTTHPIEVPVSDTDTAFSNFDGITYGKGASVLKQLRFMLGDDFKQGLKIYFKKHAFKNTNISDFFGAMEEASGKDLSGWVSDWLRTAGLNSVKTQYSCEQGKVTKFEIHQSAPAEHGTLRTHRTKIGLFNLRDGKLSQDSLVEIEYDGKKTDVADLIGRSCPDFVHPNIGDFDYVKVILDEKSLEAVKTNIAGLEDTFLRQMVWGTLWEMVHDANMGLLEFYNLAKQEVVREQNYKIKTFIMERLYENALGYLAFSKKDLAHYEAELSQIAWEELLKAEAGSDLQKEWYQAFLKVAATSEQLAILKDLLSEQKQIAGFKLDQDMRWDTIVALNRRGDAQANSILQTEEKLDSSATAAKSKIAALASRPNLDAKKKWFEIITSEHEKYSLSELTSAMKNMFPPERANWKLHFADSFYRELPKLTKTQQGHFLEEFSENFVPALCSTETVDRIKNYIEEKNKEFPTSLVKTLRISNQENQRCVDIVKKIN